MQLKHLLLILGGMLLVSCLIVAGFFLSKSLWPATTGGASPTIHSAQKRTKATVPSVPFVDITEAANVRFKHINGATPKKLLPETMGGGVAFLDIDNDGKPDLLFVNSCEWPGSTSDSRPTPILYRNRGDGSFQDVTAEWGLNVTFFGMGVAVGDFDNDGFADVFLSGVGEQHLFRNDGGKRFVDVTNDMGLDIGSLKQVAREEFFAWKDPIPFGSSATFVDYDRDGRLDLF